MPTFSTVPDRSAGDVFTESMWDSYLRDNINGLMTPPACRLNRSTSLVLGTGVSTAVPFDAEDFDNDVMHDNAVNNSRITIKTAGKYLIGGHVNFPADATGRRDVAILRNGATEDIIARITAPSATLSEYVTLPLYQNLAVNDYLELMVFQDSGGDLTLATFLRFWACWQGL